MAVAGKISGTAKSRRVRRWAMGYLFASPWLIGLMLFVAYPVLSTIYYSFTQYSVLMPPQWVGIFNYEELFLYDDLFWKSIYNTFYYVLIGVPLGLCVALGLAVLLNQKLPGLPLFRTIFYLPSIVPVVGMSILWMWLLNPQYGLINGLLHELFGIKGPGWIADPKWSKPALILMSLWGVGGQMIVFLAGLQGIPEYLYESASIDGATKWRQFWQITVPMLTPTIFFNLVMGIIGGMQVFTQSFIMTNGGPANSTLFYVFYLFNNAFRYFKMGYASAMAIILFVIIFSLTLLVLWTSKRWVHYETA